MAASQECRSVYESAMAAGAQGLLTTVAQLPTKYKIRYLTQTFESPLDLSVKPMPQTINCPITPPPSPPKKRYRDEDFSNGSSDDITGSTKILKAELQLTIQKEVTPQKPIKILSAPKTSKSLPPVSKEKKGKAMRKLKFDEDTSSPVSGTIIRPLEEIGDNAFDQPGDIDPQYNIVEVTDEAKAELAIIKNAIGAYICKLCRIEFEDAFGLARHRCSCIVLLEYRCPECGKRFNCPANLASHRRWHKPKGEIFKKNSENIENEPQHPCTECGKTFKRQAYLRKHMLTHKKDSASTTSSEKHSTQSSRSSLLTYRTDDSNSGESHLSSSYTNENNSSDQFKDYKDFRGSHYYKYAEPDDMESRSDCSSPGRLRIVESSLTEEENIAAAALAHLRNGPSVIQHTTAAVTAMAF